jgi:hypothetical protein
MTAADRNGPACRNGGKSMSKMPFLLVLRMKSGGDVFFVSSSA